MKRLLPDFMIPHCLIRLSAVVASFSDSGNAGDLEKACETLGCSDLRTAKKHRDRFLALAARVTTAIARALSRTPELSAVPLTPAGEHPPATLRRLLEAVNTSLIRAGRFRSPLSILRVVHVALSMREISDLCLPFLPGP